MYMTTGLKHCSEWVGKRHTVAIKCNIVDTDDQSQIPVVCCCCLQE